MTDFKALLYPINCKNLASSVRLDLIHQLSSVNLLWLAIAYILYTKSCKQYFCKDIHVFLVQSLISEYNYGLHNLTLNICFYWSFNAAVAAM